MPITGTLDTAYVGIGPGLVYLNTAVPANGTVATLTAGVPASGQLLGLTPEGNTINIGYDQTSVEADEVAGPIYQVVETETLSIAGSAYQVESLDMLKHLTPTGTATIAPPAAKITFGGRPDLSVEGQGSVLLSWKLRSAPASYMWFQLYKAINSDGTSFQVTRRAMTQASYSFQGQVIGTRTAGDMIGALCREGVPVMADEPEA